MIVLTTESEAQGFQRRLAKEGLFSPRVNGAKRVLGMGIQLEGSSVEGLVLECCHSRGGRGCCSFMSRALDPTSSGEVIDAFMYERLCSFA